MSEQRQCSKCGELKPVTEFSRKLSGLQVHCRECVREYNRAYRAANRERLLEEARERYRENRTTLLEQKKEYYLANQDRIRDYRRAYWEANREAIREKQRDYYVKNRDTILAKKHTYYIENKEERQEYGRKWREANRELMRESVRAWREENSEYHREQKRLYRQTPEGKEAERRSKNKRRAAIAQVEATLTAQEWSDILERFESRCAYCGVEPDVITMDHVVPLSRGGAHAADNVVPACRECNFRKHAYTPQEAGMEVLQ